MANYQIAQLNEIDPISCPCGTSRRAFLSSDNSVATLHVTDISAESKVHYHKKSTELYFILEGEGTMELDGDMVMVKPMTSVLIKPLCRHRAVGPLKVVIVPIPAHDPDDDFFLIDSRDVIKESR